MANDPDLGVSFTVDPPGMNQEGVRLPQVTRRMTLEEVLLARGTADGYALRRRYHNEATHTKFAPDGEMARDIYEAMEVARCEAVGAHDMPGTAGNIDARIAHDAQRRGYAQIRESSEAPLAVAAGYLVRHLATGRPLPEGADNVWNCGAGFIEEQAGGTLDDLGDVLKDQSAFARFTRQVISDLGYGDQLGDDPDLDDPEQDDQSDESAEDDENPDAHGEDQGGEEDASDASPEQSQDAEQDPEPGSDLDGRHVRHGDGRRGRDARWRVRDGAAAACANQRRRSELHRLLNRVRRRDQSRRPCRTSRT